MANKYKLQETENHVSCWIDTSSRHAVDALLRAYQFTIFARPRLGEPFWLSRDRRVFKQSDAVRLVDWGKLQDAVYAEELHLAEMCQ